MQVARDNVVELYPAYSYGYGGYYRPVYRSAYWTPVAVGRCPQTGAPLASQSTISRLENAPSKTEAGRLSAALLDQFGATVKPGKLEALHGCYFGIATGTLEILGADGRFAPVPEVAT